MKGLDSFVFEESLLLTDLVAFLGSCRSVNRARPQPALALDESERERERERERESPWGGPSPQGGDLRLWKEGRKRERERERERAQRPDMGLDPFNVMVTVADAVSWLALVRGCSKVGGGQEPCRRTARTRLQAEIAAAAAAAALAMVRLPPKPTDIRHPASSSGACFVAPCLAFRRAQLKPLGTTPAL